MPQTRQAKRRATTAAPAADLNETHTTGERPKKRKKAIQTDDRLEQASADLGSTTRPKGRKEAPKAEINTLEFLPRVNSLWAVGAHVSSVGGIENTVLNAAAIGANSFALFVKSQRKWVSPPLMEESIAEFKKRMKEFGYSSRMVLPHGSYLINLANPDDNKREKAYQCFLDDLRRCEALGLELYNFHPGSTVGATTIEASLGLVAACINRAHKETNNVTIILENMAGAGNIVGGDFAHLEGIIRLVEDKTRVGVCLDTCHSFAAGHDIRTKDGWEATLTKFDEQIGLHYLRAMHLNDSKTECNSRKDRHENIGLGHLGLDAFHHVLTDPRTQNIPLILETPNFDNSRLIWGTEISVLNRLSTSVKQTADGTDVDFDALVNELKRNIRSVDGKKSAGKTKAKIKSLTRARKTTELEDESQGEGNALIDVDDLETDQLQDVRQALGTK